MQIKYLIIQLSIIMSTQVYALTFGINAHVQATTISEQVYTPNLGYSLNVGMGVNFIHKGWQYFNFSHSVQVEKYGYTWSDQDVKGSTSILILGIDLLTCNIRYKSLSLYYSPYLGYMINRNNAPIHMEEYDGLKFSGGENFVPGYDLGIRYEILHKHSIGLSNGIRFSDWPKSQNSTEYDLRKFIGIKLLYEYEFK